MSRIYLLGVPIDALTSDEAVRRIRSFLDEGTSDMGHGTAKKEVSSLSPVSCPMPHRHVMTPNSEMLVEASKNPAFREVLQQAALNLPDSAGLLCMARWTGQRLPQRVTGVDTVTTLLKDLGFEHPVFLLGGAPGVAAKAAAALRARNPQLVVCGTDSGSKEDSDAPRIVAAINAAEPHLLLVAFGAPQQDVWIAKHLAEMPSVCVAMGVGGTLDFLAGERVRAPKLFQSLGCEWLWRLIKEPRRWKRILNAVVVFPCLVVRYGKHGSWDK